MIVLLLMMVLILILELTRPFDWSEDKAIDDGIGNDVGGSNDSGGVDISNNDCGGDGVDSDADNDNNVADKDHYGDKNGVDCGSNDEGGYNAESDAEDGARDNADNKNDIDFENDNNVKREFLLFSFVSISTTYDSNLSFPDSIKCK